MSSKRKQDNNGIGQEQSKKTKEPHFRIDKNMPFVCTEDKLIATILGKPQSYKRTGGNNRYDLQKELKLEFVAALFRLYGVHDVRPKFFGTDDIELTATFVFPKRKGKIPNDVDNLSKILLDCFQIPHNKIATCHNDNQVVKLSVEKKYGEIPLTTFTVV